VDKIICGDAVEEIQKIGSQTVDLVITSPPYNYGMDYDEHEDEIDWDAYFEWLNEIWQECVRVLKPGGRMCVNVQPNWKVYQPTHHLISKQLTDLGLFWKGEILWEKNNYNCKYTAWGSWKSPSNPYLKYTWEFIEVFCKGSLKKAGDKEAIDITGDEFKKWTTAKWEIAPENRMREFGHPAMFPEELPRRLIKLFSYRGDLVMDPFNGMGTTTKVAWELRRHFLGIDISEDYCLVARERLKEAKGVFNFLDRAD
jgi:DNA modification methylase